MSPTIYSGLQFSCKKYVTVSWLESSQPGQPSTYNKAYPDFQLTSPRKSGKVGKANGFHKYNRT